jgi:hypothetical protein
MDRRAKATLPRQDAMKHIKILRKLSDRSPEVLEHVIALWGQPGIVEYIHHIMHHLPPSDMEQLQSLMTVCEELKQVHLEKYPEISWGMSAEEREIRATEDFQIISDRFPHIGRRLIFTWGSYAFYIYSHTLFTDTRGGTRQGFPPEILAAITRIVKIHEERYPPLDARRLDIWADVFHNPQKN